MESILHVFEQPIVPFAILLAVILTVPPLFEKLRLPGLVGLLAAGVLLGPNALKILETKQPTMELLSDIGLVYLMFVAGLEVDMEQFRKTKYRSAGFGTFTFIVPLIFGTTVGRVFGFDWNASILIGSLFASHTLLAYPIVSRLGVVGNEAVTVTIGATIFTDIGALLVLAVCIAIHKGEFSLTSLFTLLGMLIVYSAIVLFGFDWAGRQFFRRTGDDQGNQFLFVLLAVFLAALGAELIGVEKIVGAFLAGLAVNDAIGDGPVKEKVIFVGSVLFIPIFFVDMGLLIDIPGFLKSLSSIWLTLAIVVGLITSKFLAALFAKLSYRYNNQELLTMWSLSMPQVAATLAATLVGFRAGILNEGVLNSVLVLMLVTATLGPLITSKVAPGLRLKETQVAPAQPKTETETDRKDSSLFTVVVSVRNPQTERFLIEMAAILAKHENGRIMPLAIPQAHAHLDASELDDAVRRNQMLLDRAMEISRDLGVDAEAILRIDDAVAQGISRASREKNANLIVMGWSNRTSFRARLFGNVIDGVLWASHCPVAITRLLDSPNKLQRILVPMENFTNQAVRLIRFTKILADANQAQVTLLNVCDRRTSNNKIAWTTSQMNLLAEKWMSGTNTDVKVVANDDIVKGVLIASQHSDLVVLRSERQRTAGGLAMSNITTEIVQQLNCSFVLLGEPQKNYQEVVSY
ncbi:cation:proton antiporter [Floridanema evergladense]|uniref:Cation:proton antiporter n=1 Tax=Floridaenema evergladense BLCC-F167 TaxID=3153639 RepID=A0ABV4WR06_9CYAN